MKRIYIAGPYTKGDVAQNVKAAMDAALDLIETGYAPYVPHLSHFLHMVRPQPYETWMALDVEWLEQCDAVLILPGESEGADREIDEAIARYLPIFNSLDELWRSMK
jgi:nucleoside 2-deoxyribosyltransferase